MIVEINLIALAYGAGFVAGFWYGLGIILSENENEDFFPTILASTFVGLFSWCYPLYMFWQFMKRKILGWQIRKIWNKRKKKK